MPDNVTDWKERCAELETLLGEAREEALYCRKIAEESGRVALREIQQLSKVIAARKKAEDALKESEYKFRSLFNLSPQSVILLNVETERFIDVNDKFCEITQYVKEELLELTAGDLGLFCDGDRGDLVDELTRGYAFEAAEFKIRAKDGALIDVMAFARPVRLSGEDLILCILHDMTGQKQLEKQLRYAQKMEAIGTLAGGIAHDFNNLLMAIQGNASLILLNLNTGHPHYEMMKSIEKQVRSGARLTAQLLGYARKGRYEVKPTNLNHLMRETAEAFSRTRKEIRVNLDLAGGLYVVEADQGQIEQVLLNLFVNAADAMPGGGQLHVRTRNTTHEALRGRVYRPRPGNYVLLQCIDSGKGMDKTTQERIFEPFFTTKEMGRGTGLGLASVYGIVKAHNGYIEVESYQGRGTTFSIYLPATGKKILDTGDIEQEIMEGTGTILIVDDEAMVLDVGASLLEALGYNVLQAPGGKEAVDICRDHPGPIDLVVLDLIMPDMGGGEVFDRIKEMRPGLKVLLSSGYNVDGQAGRILDRGCDGFIQKPFDINQLSAKIKDILQQR
ncbi:MAG TPA: response regulator [Syntrophobacter fumaroxidans]|nr:response regulator [Syntrophobacter fumaroxidans]